MIFILGTPEETAQALDDKALGEMIKAIAQALCNVHWFVWNSGQNIPLQANGMDSEWSQWSRECRANYLELVKYAIACCVEYYYRLDSFDSHYSNLPKEVAFHNKYKDVIAWCADNVPDLPTEFVEDGVKFSRKSWFTTPFPLVMPEKYIQAPYPDHGEGVIFSYKTYYKALLEKDKKRKTAKPCWKHDCCIYAKRGYCIMQNLEPTWTRRTKPSWLGDL
jgi:hypothetical protein